MQQIQQSIRVDSVQKHFYTLCTSNETHSQLVRCLGLQFDSETIFNSDVHFSI